MKKKLLAFAFIFCVYFSFSQNSEIDRIFPGSPEANAFAEYGKIPVNLYNGLVNINLPLMELPGRSSSIPFSLSYHSAGNKVNEISSSIGLGWTLNMGGVITRVVRGLHDDDPDGYVGINQRGVFINNTPITSWSDLQENKFVFSVWDSEPDLYYFNILGRSGSFTLNANGQVIMMPENDFKIQPAIGPLSTNSYWTLTDKEGNIYKFGVNSNQKENVKVSRTISQSNLNYPAREFVSAWYLSSLTTATGEYFNFYYTNGLKTEYVDKAEEYVCCGNFYKTYTTKTEILNPVILTKVISDMGYVEVLSEPRLDLTNGHRITSLKLFNNNNNLVKTISFNQYYFNSIENCPDPECKRLRLSSIMERENLSQPYYKYQFQYNTADLPKRGSPQIDHWGYYNANGQTDLIPRSDPMNVELYRNPNESKTMANVLEKIIYPTGGYTKFTYGLNEYAQGQLNIGTGGLRIESVEDGGDVDQPVVTTYSYTNSNSSVSSGVQYGLPVYKTDWQYVWYENGQTFFIDKTNVSSSAYNQLLDLNGSNVGYSNIVTNFPDTSKEIVKYTNLTSNPDVRNIQDYFSYNSFSNSISGYINPLGSPHGPPSTQKSYQRGLLTEKILKNSDDDEVYHLWNNYAELAHSNPQEAIGYKFFVFVHNYQQQAYLSYTSKYKERNGNYQLVSSIEKKIADSGEITVTNNYEYSFTKPTMLKSNEIVYNTGNTKKTVYKYPFDLINIEQTPYMQNLVNANRISDPVITELFEGTEKIFEEHVKYGNSTATGNLLLPIEEHKRKGSSNINIASTQDRKLQFIKYDGNGNLLEYKTENGMSTCIIWGYNDLLPIAKIENATYSQISFNILNDIQDRAYADFDHCLDSQNCNEKNLRTALESLRVSLPSAMVTSYTYDPLIGVTSVTDPKGDTVYYEYDDQNRLEFIKDDLGKIMTKNEYHYKD